MTGWGGTRRAVLAGFAAFGVAAGARAQARPRLSLVTGAPGGAFHLYGPAMSEVVSAHAGLDIDVETTGGSNDNLRAVGRGDADLGLVNMGPAFEAWEGQRAFKADGPLRTIRALLPMYETPFSVIALRSSGIDAVAGLAGRAVGVGPAGGPAEGFFKALSDALGLGARIVTGAPNDLGRRLVAGEIDAFWFGAGVPVAAFTAIGAEADAVVFGLSPDAVAALRAQFPYFAPSFIPAGSYKDQTSPLPSASIWNFVVGSERLGDEQAYAITKAVLDHAGALAARVAAASGTAARNAPSDTFLPFHPGAVRYYREVGVSLPAALVPA